MGLGIATKNIKENGSFSTKEILMILAGFTYPAVAYMFIGFSIPSLIISAMMGVYVVMSMEDEREMMVYAFYNYIIFALIVPLFVYYFDKVDLLHNLKNSLFPFLFLVLMGFVPSLSRTIGTADLKFMTGNLLLYTLLGIDPLYVLISWLIAYLIFGVRNMKCIHKGKLTEPKPFLYPLALASEILLSVSVFL
jgi:Flp pilus assembly protein protease CpaA